MIAIPILILATITATPHDRLLSAIHVVEASGQISPKDGDGGKAIGPFQIHRAYWKDATDYDRTIGGTYEDCRNLDYSRRVVLAYWRRYAPKNATDEQLARIHNGGPTGHRRESTLRYWRRVERELRKSCGSD